MNVSTSIHKTILLKSLKCDANIVSKTEKYAKLINDHH